ncbi:MAG: hypothetical protein O3B41_11995 [Bacteroidetes bacterium]|nr:hypothetical protein [Bacteroidota bacterium]
MKDLPADVVAVKNFLFGNPSHDLYEFAAMLIKANSPELVDMWRTLERQNPIKKMYKGQKMVDSIEERMWVWIFLEHAAEASKLPPFHYLPVKQRKALSSKITTLANQLAWELEHNQLDGHLIFSDGTVFNGFYLYEDFGESNQQRIDETQTQKLKVSELIQRTAKRAVGKIIDEPMSGKSGKNVRAIHFIRLMAGHNKFMYWKPLHAVTATAANTIFGTSYEVADITKLLTR